MLVITRPGTCFVQAIHESEVCRTALRLLRPWARHRCWYIYIYTYGWWFGFFLIFPNSWDDDPIWLSYFSDRLKPRTSIYIYIVWIFHSKIILSLDLKVSSPVLGTWELLPDFSGIHSQGILQVNKEYSDITWLVVSNMFYFPFSIWDVILPIDELHHFSGG